MTIWRPAWDSLAARTAALIAASQIYVETLKIRNEDPFGTADQYVLPQARLIFLELQRFLDSSRSALPPLAATALSRFCSSNQDRFTNTAIRGLQGVQALVPALATVTAEVSFLVSDFDAVAIKKIELAFLHLQQLICVDQEVRRRWQEASRVGERACEQLGAVHLLSHGVYAFKADAAGSRTDLILGIAPDHIDAISRATDAMVLTEWKLVRQPREVEVLAQRARTQLALYTSGALAAYELRSIQYVVLVTAAGLTAPPDTTAGSKLTRHIVISVEPEVPSVTAKRQVIP